MAQRIYQEKVAFRQYDVLALLAALSLASFILFVEHTFFSAAGPGFRSLALAAIAVALAARMISLIRASQRTRVTSKNLKVELGGFRNVKAKVPVKDIVSLEVVESPNFTRRFDGLDWLNPKQHMSLTGKNGISITLRDGREFFVGSPKPTALLKSIRKANPNSNRLSAA